MPIQFEGDTYLTTSEACERVDVSRETLNNYVKAGKLNRFKKKGRTSYYKQSELDSLFKIRKEDTGIE